MKILVLLKMVPDIVEELELGPDGRSLRADALRLIVSERDEHALEQGLLLKERVGGTVTVLALDGPDIDDVLFTALARGSDRAVKVTGAGAAGAGAAALTTSQTAALLAGVLPAISGLMPADLVLTGCQSIDDLDGMAAPILAEALGLPFLGTVTGVELGAGDGRATVLKEYAGGVRGRYTVCLPAVLGIQAAEKPPRYVPVAKVRAAMKSLTIETAAAAAPGEAPLEIVHMAKPVVAGGAEMLEGGPQEVATRVVDLLAARGLL